jgi:hypothetical protein
MAGAAAVVTGAMVGPELALAAIAPAEGGEGAPAAAEAAEETATDAPFLTGRAISLSDVRYSITATDFPVEFDAAANKLYLSGSAGQIYSVTPFTVTPPALVAKPSGMGRIIRLLFTSDDEVLAVDSERIRRSSGWASNPSTASWTTVLTVNSGGGVSFQKFGIDGDGTKFIATQYGAPGPDSPEWQRSRFVHISTDRGSTWRVVWDTEARFPGGSASSHLHAACYDPWEDRFWFTEGHGVPVGAYWSSNDGGSWTKLGGTNQPNPMPTVMVATDDGIVCGTDHEPNGVFGIPRCTNPTDMRLVQLFRWEPGAEGLVGFAQRGWRDPRTGLVWIGFNSVVAGVAPIIAAGTATGAGEIWRDPTGALNDRVWEVFPVNDGRVVGHYLKDGTNRLLTGYQHGAGLDRAVDPGRTGRGIADKGSSIAVGFDSFVSGLRSLAIGRGARNTATQESVAIGASSNVSGTDVVAVGFGAVASGYQSIAIGKAVNSAGTQSVVMGTNATATAEANMVGIGHAVKVAALAATAVGANAAATATDTIAIGAGASAGGGQSTVVGRSAATTGAQNTLVGHSAGAGATNGGVVVGRNATAGGSNSVVVGAGATGALGPGVFVGWGATGTGGDQQTLLGTGAASNRQGATALGHGATANHFRAVALGQGCATSADTQVSIGDRHVELAETRVLAAPAADRARLWVEDNGSGKTRLMVRFSSGAAVQLAVEP